MLAKKAFFSFAEVIDPDSHRAYNEWHQLDHRPENLALPGVIWGERWVKSPDCAKVATGNDDGLGQAHYVNLYWFRDPVDEAFAEWRDLGARSYQWGRRPEVRFVRRPMTQVFVPVKGYVHPRVLVSADVLPCRPNRGVHITVSELAGDTGAIEELFHWYDQVRIPDLLQCRGVAGAWTFASEAAFGHGQAGVPESSSTRILVLFLDENPLDVVAEIDRQQAEWAASGRHRDTSALETIRFASPLRNIVPWEWDWFDGDG
jgi:hypothetical protein